MSHVIVWDGIPTEVVPGFASSLAYAGTMKPAVEITFPDVHRERSGIEHVDSPVAVLQFAMAKVLFVSGPHLSIRANQLHAEPPEYLRWDLRPFTF